MENSTLSPAIPMLDLNDGRAIPQLGLGTWKVEDAAAARLVEAAAAQGYRHFDTAMIYRNEAGVGEGLRRSGVPRGELFVTTKLWNSDQGFDRTLRAFDASLGRLGLDYVDLYLIHWPIPTHDLYVETWRALIRLRDEGRARSIGVSNFNPPHLDRLIAETGVVPVVNQIELHPRFQQAAARAAHGRLGIVIESWSPLGQGALLDHPVLTGIARKHGRTVAQIVLRWHVEQGLVVIPKTSSASRLRENAALFDFALDADDLAAIAGLDDMGGRMGEDPEGTHW